MKIENIYIFGVGAAGSNILMNLVFALNEVDFSVIDFDKVELRNISAGTQPYSRADLNRPKIQAIQKIVKIASNKSINGINRRIESEKDIKEIVPDAKTSLIIDCFDNADSRNLFFNLGKEYNILHVGFSGTLTGEATWHESYEKMNTSKSDGEIDVCQMAMARPFISGLSAIASLNVAKFIESGEKISCYFDKDLKLFSWK